MVVWSEDEDELPLGSPPAAEVPFYSFWSQQDDAPGDPHRAVGEGGDDAVVTSAGRPSTTRLDPDPQFQTRGSAGG